MSTNPGENGGADDSSIESRIDELAERFLDELIGGGTPDRKSIVAEHPDLAPGLDSRLRLVESLHKVVARHKHGTIKFDHDVTRDDNSRTVDRLPRFDIGGPSAHRINCPHCGNQLQLVDQRKPLAEITCDGCGSTIVIDTQVTRSQGAGEDLPEKIGRFPIVAVIGQGGFGVVYKGWDEVLARYVAIKIPRSGYFASVSERQRFLREARNAGQLQHPHIVRIHDVAETSKKGFPYIVSDFIEGLTLSDLIETRRLGFRDAAQLMLEVAEAIEHAHSRQIIHRDIKPSNILVDRDLQPHVTDFGLARDSAAEIAITMDGEILGTPAYMSPEQAQGELESIDVRSDVYSIGVVLFRLFSGELPFRGSRRMLLHQVVNDLPPLPRKVNDTIPRDLETVTLKAISKEPHLRYQTAQDLADDLRRWLNKEPIRARRIGLAGRFTRWCRRRPLVAALSSTIATLLALTLVLSVVWAIRENDLRQKETESKQAAIDSQLVANRRLTELLVANGVGNLDQNRLIDALLWFAEARQTEPDDPWPHQVRTNLIASQCPTLTGVWQMPDNIATLRFTSDGSRFLACSKDGQVSLFRTNVPNEPGLELKHGESVFDAKISPDDQLILVRGDQQFFLWSAETGQQIARLEHAGVVAGFDFSPDSRRIVTTAHDGSARIWDVRGQELAVLAHTNTYVTLATFSPDAGQLLTVSKQAPQDPGEAQIWELATGQLLQTFQHPKHITDARFDSSGQRVATASGDRTVRVWNVADGSAACPPLVHAAQLSQVIWLDEQHLASISLDGRLHRWNVSTGAPVEPGFHSRIAPLELAVSQQRNIAAIAGNDGYVRVIWLAWGEPVCSLLPCGETATAVTIHPNGRTLITGNQRGLIKSWDLAGVMSSATELPHRGTVNQVRISPEGDRILTCSDDATARLWQLADGNSIGESMTHQDRLSDADFDRSGQFAATTSIDATAQLWDANSGIASGPQLVHDHPLVRVALDPWSDRMATADDEGRVQVWTFQNQQPDFSIRHNAQVNSIRFSPDGRLIATASLDQTARLWQAEDGRPYLQPVRHDGMVTFCNFSPGGDLLVTCGRDRIARITSISGDGQLSLPHSGSVSSANFNSAGDALVTTDYQGNARIWSPDDGRLTSMFSNQEFQFNYAEFHPHRHIVAVSAGRRPNAEEGILPRGGAVFLWDPVGQAPLSPPLFHLGNVRRARFSPDGLALVTASADRLGRIWRLEPDERDPILVSRLAALLGGQTPGIGNRRVMLEPDRQITEFRALRQAHPEWFRCSSEDIDRWNTLVQRLAESADQLNINPEDPSENADN